MPMQEDIETVVDRLLTFVRTNGRVSIKDAAKALALTPAQVEKIALLLEQSKLLSVKYDFFGVFLEPGKQSEDEGTKGPAQKPSPQQLPAEKPAKGSPARSEVSIELSRLEREVLVADNLLTFFEKDIARRTLLIESILDDLESHPNYTNEELLQASKEMDTAISQLESFATEISKLSERREHLQERLFEFRVRLQNLKNAAGIGSPVPSSNWGAFEPLRRMIEGILHSLRRLVHRPKPLPPIQTPLSNGQREPQAREKQALSPLAIIRGMQGRVNPSAKGPAGKEEEPNWTWKGLSNPPLPPLEGEGAKKKKRRRHHHHRHR